LVDDRLGEERHGHMAIADVEVVRTSPIPSEGLIGVEKLLNVPAFGIVTSESVGFIVVSRGQEGLESPVGWMLPQALHELKKGLPLRVGKLEGQLGSGKASPMPAEAFRRDEGELFAHSRLHRHGHQQVKLRVLVDLIEEVLGEVLGVGQH